MRIRRVLTNDVKEINAKPGQYVSHGYRQEGYLLLGYG